MWDKLRTMVAGLLAPDAGLEANPEQLVELAGAALMVEVIAADYQQQPEERQALLAAVEHQFGLDPAQAQQLLERAQQAHDQATDYFRFTSDINDHCTPEQKVLLIEGLWRVAYADGELHPYEEHVIRRVADLVHLSHFDFIAAKHRAEASLTP